MDIKREGRDSAKRLLYPEDAGRKSTETLENI
jgi:hypothetical protein